MQEDAHLKKKSRQIAPFNAAESLSMTQLLMHTVAHSTRPSFRSKTNNQPTKKFLSLAVA